MHGCTLFDDVAVTVETFTRELTLTHEEEVAAYAEIFEEFRMVECGGGVRRGTAMASALMTRSVSCRVSIDQR